MQGQHPPGRQVGGRIYYGAYYRREKNCKKCLVTSIHHNVLPDCFDIDNNWLFRVVYNLAYVVHVYGVGLIFGGIFSLVCTIRYFKKTKSPALTASGNSYAEPAPTTLTYNQAGQSVNGRSQHHPSEPQPEPVGPQSYPTAPQSYPGSQQYSPSQSGPTGTTQSLRPPNPPPPYSDTVRLAVED